MPPVSNDERLGRIEDLLGYRFNAIGLLVQALSHSSYVNENPAGGGLSNERLEFLGDAVLELIITRHLYEQHPGCTEGELTLMRSVLVSEGTLAALARNIGLGQALYLGKGEASSGGDERRSNLSNALEAVLAAVYLDGGVDEAARVTGALFADELALIVSQRHRLNYKNLLQHYSQERDGMIPDYHIIASQGPQHEKLFEVEVRLGGEPLGRGAGHNKKEAEQEAAQQALRNLRQLGQEGASP
ncbi:MAG: ribonuclease III [Candidatus Aureabacteria bacterium]|nr:ribonuclease III [Candidatus Auribacterota bacterium]